MKEFDINKIKVAYTYLSRMADGRNPVTNHSVEDEILDNPNVIRCLHYFPGFIRMGWSAKETEHL